MMLLIKIHVEINQRVSGVLQTIEIVLENDATLDDAKMTARIIAEKICAELDQTGSATWAN
jgi:hypothetical protein